MLKEDQKEGDEIVSDMWSTGVSEKDRFKWECRTRLA